MLEATVRQASHAQAAQHDARQEAAHIFDYQRLDSIVTCWNEKKTHTHIIKIHKTLFFTSDHCLSSYLTQQP